MRLTSIAAAIGAAASLATPVWAQQVDHDARYRALVGRGVASLIRGGTVAPRWLRDGNAFWYPESAGDSVAAWRVDPVTNARTALVDAGRLRRALTQLLGRDLSGRGLPGINPRFSEADRTLQLQVDGDDVVVDLATYQARRAPVLSPAERDRSTPRLVRTGFPQTAPDAYEVPSPDGRWFLGERDHNVWLRATADGRDQALTNDGTAEQLWSVHSDISLGTFGDGNWSPDGNRVVLYRTDVRGVGTVPLLHWLKPTEEVEYRTATKAGGLKPQADLWVVDIRNGQRTRLDTGPDRDVYLSLNGWLPDGSEVLATRVNRIFQRLDVLAFDPATGKARTLFQETQRTFIKGIGAPGWGDLVTLLPKSRRFVAISERDGWDHLYLYDWQGRLIRRLTTGRWPVTGLLAVDEDGGWVYFTGHDDPVHPYDTHLYRVGLDGLGFKRLTDGPGRHAAEFSPSRKFYLDTHSSLTEPPVAELHAADGRLLQALSRADVSRLDALGWKPPEPFRVKAADDTTDLEGVIYKPFDFSPARKYPVVVYLYGGPQLVLTPHGFPSGYDDARSIALAQLGFIVVTVDPRGTPERGKAFQDWVYGNWGRYVIPDQVATLRQLAATRPFMDMTRVGVFGLSWGGYHTIRAMVQAPETFQVGVAIAPVADLDDHMAVAIEPYMGLPAQNRPAYDYASNLRMAGKMQGRLMLMHGTSDVNATFSATMKMVNALIEAGKPYDLVVVPEMNHGPGPTRIRYFEDAIRRYLVEHLRPDLDKLP